VWSGMADPRLFEAEGETGKRNGDLKVGCKCGRIVKEIKLPKITTAQRVRWAILCSLEVYDQPEYRRWAADWLLGKNRTAEAAWPVAWATEAAEAAWTAEAAAWAATEAAEEAAWAAARATEAAVAMAAEEVKAAAWAARAVEAARAARAVEVAARAGRIPLVELAERAIRDEVV